MMGVLDDVWDKVKRAYELSRKIKDVKLRELIAELRIDVVSLKEEQVALREQNVQFRQRIEDLQRVSDIRSKVERRGNFYYLTEPIPGYGEGPFCLTCLDVEGKLVSMHSGTQKARRAGTLREETYWRCGNCQRKLPG